ncbi:MAG: diguanylate cyclase [Coriobacteriales bacterium]|nr:diguanylate cyclase [Coriobacteriales bacterium]
MPGVDYVGIARNSTTARLAGFGIVAALSIAFVRLSLIDSHAAVSLAQVIYVLPPFAATVFSGLAAFKSGAASRERRMWAATAVLMGSLFLGEAALSVRTIFLGGQPPTPGMADVFFAIAIFALFVLLVVLAGIGTLPRATRVRVVADTIVLLALLDTLLFAGWVRGLLGAHVDSLAAVIAAVYTVQAATAGGVAFFLWLGNRERPAPRWAFDLGIAFLVYSLGLLLWPAWNVAWVLSESRVAEFTAELAYLVGYGLIATAALQRLVGRKAWEPPAHKLLLERERPWSGLVMSGTVVLAMGILVALTLGSPMDSRRFGVYFSATALAGLGILVRSASASFEGARLRHDALSDPVSGVGNHRSFHDRLGEITAEADRSEATVGLILLDLDAFSTVNTTRGYDAGDDALRAVAVAIQRALRPGDAVFRMSGDEFAVLMAGGDAEATEQSARRLLAAVRTVEAADMPMTASVGVAIYPDDGRDADSLVRSAEAAREWAKCHGKCRIVLANSGVSAALDADERVRLAEEGMRLDLARGLSAAVDAREVGNPYHSRNVAMLAVLLGQRLGMAPDELARLEAAALLHDVGKLALSDEVLRCSSRAAALQRKEIPVLGESFCASIGFSDVAQFVRSHRECWDGSGYPDGLSGDEIPLHSRLLALCGEYDVLTSGRSHRGPLSKGAALQEIDLGLGTRFDPELAEVFISVVGDHGALGWSEPREVAS